MCFGGSDDSSSKEMIQMQKDEAKRVAAAEADRQARVTQGLSLIRNMFQGAPVMKSVAQKFDWGNFAAPANARGVGTGVSGLPAGYTYVQVPGATGPAAARAPVRSGSSLSGGGTASRSGLGGGNTGQQNSGVGASGSPTGGGHHPGSTNNSLATSVPTTRWAIRGPDGRIYNAGEDLGFNTQADTGQRSGQWQDQFVNDFKQKMLNYYQPQVTDQLTDARKQTGASLARAGLASSTAGIMAAADLEKQKLLREGEVLSKADTAAGELRTRIAREQKAAEDMVYATENPEVAANAATRGIQNITAEDPGFSPLAEMFTLASIGGANLYKGASNASRMAQGFGSSSTGRNQKLVGSA